MTRRAICESHSVRPSSDRGIRGPSWKRTTGAGPGSAGAASVPAASVPALRWARAAVNVSAVMVTRMWGRALPGPLASASIVAAMVCRASAWR